MVTLFGDDYSEIPSVYTQLVNGQFEDFISVDEFKRYKDVKLKCIKENAPENIPGLVKFINSNYFVSQDIHSLIWYKDFLNEVIRDGVVFNDDMEGDVQNNDSNEKHSDIRSSEAGDVVIHSIDIARDSFVKFTISVLNRYPNAQYC